MKGQPAPPSVHWNSRRVGLADVHVTFISDELFEKSTLSSQH